MTLPPSFVSKVVVDEASGCWVWSGVKVAGGYGRFTFGGRKHLAHRFAFINAKPESLDGLDVDHLCRNRACVNPDHLEAVTHAENVRRGMSLIADNAKKTECKYGHPLSGDNLKTYERSPGRVMRSCRTCSARIWSARSRARAA